MHDKSIKGSLVARSKNTNMASHTLASSVSEVVKKIETFVEGFLSSSNRDSYKLVEYLVADEEKLKWLGSLEDLKLFTESSLCLDGKWSSPCGFAKKFTLKSVEPDQQQFGFVWYRQKQNTIVFQGDVMSIESAKSRLLSIANKQNVASIGESEQLFDELDLQVRDSESSCEESLTASCDGVDRGECDSSATSIVGGKSQTECTSRSSNGLLTRSTSACPCVRGEIIAEIEGIKLDLVILKSQSCSFTSDQYDSLQSSVNLLKSTQKSLENIIKIQGETINSLQQEILTFESKFLSLEELLFNDNPQLNASLDHNSQIQCTAESHSQGSDNVARKSNCKIPLPTHSGNNQSLNILKDNSIAHSIGKSFELSSSDQLKRSQPYENCKTVCISPESSPKVTTNIPDPLVSDTDLLPESSINLQANVDPVIPVSDANLPPRVIQAPSDATLLKRNSSLSKNETPCPFILRRGWCLKGDKCDFSHRNMVNNFQLRQFSNKHKGSIFCPFLRKKGYCLKESRCDFSHAVSRPIESQLAANDNPQRPQIHPFLRSHDLQNIPTLMQRLEQRLQRLEYAQISLPVHRHPMSQPLLPPSQTIYPRPLMETPVYPPQFRHC